MKRRLRSTNAWWLVQSPSTRAWRMNSWRAAGPVDPVVTDRAALDDRQPVQRDRLRRHRRAAPGIPPRLAVRAPHEVGADALGPLRLDRGDPPGPQPVRLDELGRHHPPRRRLGQHRAGGDRERRAARAAVLAAVAVAHARCATAARRAPTGGRGPGAPPPSPGTHAEVGGDRAQLAEQVLPLPHAEVVEVLGPAQLAELVRRQRPLPLAQVVPQRDDRQQVAARHVEAAVQLVGRLACPRPAARAGPGSTARRRSRAPRARSRGARPRAPSARAAGRRAAGPAGARSRSAGAPRRRRPRRSRRAPRAGGSRRGSTPRRAARRTGTRRRRRARSPSSAG